MKTLVIGATNIDIIGVGENKLVERDSNIGLVSITVGGVAKNIAEDLKYLGEDIDFLTYVGRDVFTHLLCKHFDELELNYSQSYFSEDQNNIYLAIHENDGDMKFGLNDLNRFKDLNPDFFASKHSYIDSFDTLVLDCNLSEESLEYLLKTYKDKRIFVEGVSQIKVKKIRNLLKYIDLLKINNLELNALLNKDICDIIKGVKELIDFGIKNVIVSSGKDPIIYNLGKEVFSSEVPKPKFIVSTVGAGDALLAGIVRSKNRNLNMHDAVEFAKKVACKTLETESACNKDISELINL